MQTRLLIFATFLLLLGQSFAATALLPDVPTSALTPKKVLAIAQKELGPRADQLFLVGIEWCQSSQFKPRYSTGGEFMGLRENPGEYCWFVTFVEKPGLHPPVPDDHLPRDLAAVASARRPFREVFVLRVKNDGTAHLLVEFRT